MSSRRRLSRRGLLGAALGGGATLGAGGLGWAAGAGSASPAARPTVPFHGVHQAGIATEAQDRLAFAAFDVTTSDRAALRQLLSTWSAAAGRMTAGRPVGTAESPGGSVNRELPPPDTGEADGLPPARLTLTIGYGPSLFDARFGLSALRPAALAPLPVLPGDDRVEAARSSGDIGVQACADDPQVAFHAVRTLARLARGTAVLRWMQLGFGRTSTTSAAQSVPRNLMGFHDGTNNIRLEDHADLDAYVWVGDETDQPWMRGGSYCVTRRIRMLIESWDRDPLSNQEAVFGRARATGDRLPVMAADAHVRLAAPEANRGQKLLRRGYSYTDGMDPVTGQLDAGLFFIAYQKDPRAQFVPIQRRLSQFDALNEYISHTGSALFACPPGPRPGSPWGTELFGASPTLVR